MKKIFCLMLLPAFFACTIKNQEIKNTKNIREFEDVEDKDIPKPEYNEKCSEIKKVKIIQVLGDGALGLVCNKDDEDSYCSGMTVAIKKQPNEDSYDEKIVTPPIEKCFVINGTYKYKNLQEVTKTVPILDYEYEYTPKSLDEALERLNEMKEASYSDCLIVMNRKFKNKKDNQKKCKCITDLTFKKILENKDNILDNKNNFMKSIEKESHKCGTFPKGFF